MDALRNAYATLGLAPGSSARDVRRQFKKLVKRWHPDRFGSDPQGQSEAAQRMREINAAYELIQSADRAPAASTAPTRADPGVTHAEPRDRVSQTLGRSAVEGIVRSIGTESPVDVVFAFLAWSWPLFLALLINPPRYQWLQDELAGRPHSSVAFWQLLLVGLSFFLRFWQRRSRQERS